MFDYKYKYPVESIAKQVYTGNAMCWAKKCRVLDLNNSKIEVKKELIHFEMWIGKQFGWSLI